jgi:hypothetical protein
VKPKALVRYERETHYEVLDGVALFEAGKKRNGGPKNVLAIVVYHFTDEGDARSFARLHGRKLFRVDRKRRTEIQLRPARAVLP